MSDIYQGFIDLPLAAVDAFMESSLRSFAEARPSRLIRVPLTYGSVRYTLLARRIPCIVFEISAIDTAITMLNVNTTEKTEKIEDPEIKSVLTEFGINIAKKLHRLGLDLRSSIAKHAANPDGNTVPPQPQTDVPLTPAALDEIGASLGSAPESKRPGPRTSRANQRALKRFAAGESVDDVLSDYAREKRINEVKARELLRKLHKKYEAGIVMQNSSG